ncbi:glycosyltransferase domain-containing protein [Criblamydia sequanensis]|uniref:Secreted protein n=1 Tax=Candidatus Criblamydia sequanensis CRIB-18 TaxID=1437425 RepID=A0A090CXT2_9BACT|nr:glycosyltransferase domain-containing protein [Criblamydia sequanensis]CDR33002.1 putative secreted protein [Criblamydia sequanensis CRIB-18]
MKNFTLFIFLLISSVIVSADESLPLHICTVASRPKPGLQQLLLSAEKFGLKVEVLGMGLPYKKNGQKLSYMKMYLENIPDTDLVLFVDAYDVIFLANENVIKDKFYSFNSPFVISAETNCFPFQELASAYPESPTLFKYLNSGTYMGYAGYIKFLLNEFIIEEDKSDQGQLTKLFLRREHEITLDYYSELFMTLHGIRGNQIKLEKDPKLVHCLLTGSTPSIIHGNGLGKKLYQHIFNTLFGKQ